MKTADPPRPDPPRWRRWGLRLGVVVAACLAFELLAWAAVPALIAWQLPKRASAALGRPVSVGAVSFVPWRLDLELRDLAIGPAPATPGAAPLLRIARLHADLSAASLWRLAPVVEALQVDGLDAGIARLADGRYDVDDLIARFAKPPAAPDTGTAPRFALYNVELRGARLRFDDRPVGRVQQVDALEFRLPFLSNLPADIDVKVEPRLAFRLNGAAFDSGAQATPFAATRPGELRLETTDLDLAPYLGYLPADLPLRLVAGRLTTALTLGFALPPNAPPRLVVRGSVEATDVRATDAAGRPQLGWRRLRLAIADLQPFARRATFASLQVDGLEAHVRRGADGRVAFAVPGGAASAAGTGGSRTAAGQAASAAAAASSGSVAGSGRGSPAPPWQVEVGSVELDAARIFWTDASVAPPVDLWLDAVTARAERIVWPTTRPTRVSVHGELHTAPAAGAVPPIAATWSAAGPVDDRSATLDLRLDKVAFGAFGPYLAQVLVPAVDGTLAAHGTLTWSGAAAAPRLQATFPSLVVDGLRLREAARAADRLAGSAARTTARAMQATAPTAEPPFALQRLALDDLAVDLLGHTVVLGRARLQQPALRLARDAAGRWNALAWLIAPPGSASTAPESMSASTSASSSAAAGPDVPAAGRPAPAAWRVRVGELAVEAGRITVEDAAAPGRAEDPVKLAVSNLNLRWAGLDWRAGQPLPPGEVELGLVLRDGGRAGRPAAVERAGSAAATPGGAPAAPASRTDTLGFRGRVGFAPLVVDGELRVERFPVELVMPYVAAVLPVELTRARAGYVGKASIRQAPDGFALQGSGDALLADVHVAARPAPGASGAAATDRSELLNWQSLALKRISVAVAPGAGRPRVDIGEAALTDFYARLLVTEAGRLNLQTLTGGSAPVAPPAAGTSASAPAPAPAPASAPPFPVDIRVGGIRLQNGRVDYTDHFVHPNYSTALTELNGAVGAIGTSSRELAPIELHGRAAGTATLSIEGRANPLARPPVLDLKARATDLELAPLSPYSGKYVGYAIERGKLSVNLAYSVAADGRLQATNQVVLNQLTFGPRVESKDATTLPVTFAVALLKDRNGVIDLDLPISGSLNDPQFSLGTLIWRLVGNLVTKAIASPFAWLTGGGGAAGMPDDPGAVAFEPGTAALAPDGRAALAKVAGALAERPALRLTLTGTADPVQERDAFRRAALDAQLVARERADRLRQGREPGAGAPAAFVPGPASAASGVPSAAAADAARRLGADQRARLLTEVYRATDLPGKPRNLLGLAKDVPPAEMEALLQERIPVDADAMRALALQRAIAARDALIAGGLSSDRLFLAAPEVEPAAPGAGPPPGVRLGLSSR